MTRALIIGGGIAGPVAAMALQRVGIEAVVFEAYEESAGLAVGGWLTVAVNGLDALRALDLHRPVMAIGFPGRTIELRSGTGKLLGVVPIGGELADGTITHTLKRADLYGVLLAEARRRGVRVETGRRLVDAEVLASGQVVARFGDGGEARGDVLVGADGIHSRVRRLIDPQAPHPRYTGLGNVGGFSPHVPVDLAAGTYQMVFGKRAFFGYTVAPGGEVWWFANPPRPTELPRDELAAMTTEDWKQHLCALFADDVAPAVDIIRATEGRIVGTNQHDMPAVPRWRRGPLVIIGDAAHAAAPSSGQGASMAIEDGLELARSLRDAGDVAAALATYERLRRDRVERVVAHGARMGSAKTVGPVGRVVRDLVMPWFIRRMAASSGKDSLAWLFDHHIELDAPVAAAA